MFFFCRFILENFVFDKHMRYILTIYPVVIWALTGNLMKNYDASSPNRNGLFIGKTKLEHKKRPTNVPTDWLTIKQHATIFVRLKFNDFNEV